MLYMRAKSGSTTKLT